MTTRRSVLLASAAALSATGGCLGFATDTAPLETEAERTMVADGALAETGYEVKRSGSMVDSHTITLAGQSREVEATCYVSEYRRSLSIGALEDEYLGTFGVRSAPMVELFGRTFHPLEGRSVRQLAGTLQSQYDDFEDMEHVETDTVVVLGEPRDVDVYEAEGEREGESIDVTIHVLLIGHDRDKIAGIGVYPTSLSGERQRIHSLFTEIRHG